MSVIPVSTVLLVRNGIRTLPAYLDSMRDIDDIVVLDGGSTDGTLELLKAHSNCRVFPQDSRFLDADGRIIDFSGMRNYGYSLLRHPWVLCIDADEELSPELREEIRTVVTSGKPGAYYVRRRFTLHDREVVTLKSDDHIRLFHTSVVRGCVKPVHERLDVVDGTYRGKLSEDVIVPLGTAREMRPKYDRYMQIDLLHLRDMTWGRWLRWMLLRNIVTTIRRCFVILIVRVLPRRGPRYPLSLEWEQLRYLWLLTWRAMPFFVRR